MKYLFFCFFLVGCAGSATRDTTDNGNWIPITITGFSTEDVKTKARSARVISAAESDDVELASDIHLVSNGLQSAGFVLSENPDYKVRVEFSKEDPALGKLRIGRLTPYKHSLVIKAFRAEVMVWKTEAKGESTSADRREILPHLLVASSKYFGTNTYGQVRASVQENDPRVKELKSKL